MLEGGRTKSAQWQVRTLFEWTGPISACCLVVDSHAHIWKQLQCAADGPLCEVFRTGEDSGPVLHAHIMEFVVLCGVPASNTLPITADMTFNNRQKHAPHGATQ